VPKSPPLPRHRHYHIAAAANSALLLHFDSPRSLQLFPAVAWDRPPEQLARDEYFVAGDNGFRSCDSRVWGALKSKYIVGTARIVIWPLDDFGPVQPGALSEVKRLSPSPVKK